MEYKHESVFVSLVRSFLKTIGVLVGIGVAFVIIGMGAGTLSDAVDLPDKAELTVSADAEGNRKLLPSSAPVILKIDVHGVIGLKDLTDENFTNIMLSSREGALANGRVKGIILHVTTPGGIASTSGLMYRLLKDYKEKYNVPIYAYAEGMCASGGMYITSAADQLWSGPETIIGSIGVRWGPSFNFYDAMTKIGIGAKTLTAGIDKDELNPFRPWKDDEGTSIDDIVKSEYARFVNVVTEARKGLSKENLINVYGARIFGSEKAAEYGYVDKANASYEDTLSALVKAAGIEEGTQYQVISIAPCKSIFKDLAQNRFGLLRGKVEHVIPIGPYMTNELSGKLLYLHQL